MGKPKKKGMKVARKMKSSTEKSNSLQAAVSAWHRITQKISYQYEVQIGLETVGHHRFFTDALRQLFAEIKQKIDEGTANWQYIESTCGISSKTDPLFKYKGGFLNFCDARDLGYKLNIVKDGKVINTRFDGFRRLGIRADCWRERAEDARITK